MSFVSEAQKLKGTDVAILLRGKAALSGRLLEIDEDVIILEVEGNELESSEVKKWEVLIPLSSVQYIQLADAPLVIR